MSDWSSALERRIEERTAQVAVVGMGQVGLSLAVELGRAGLTVRGIDLDIERVNRLNRGESYLVDVPSDALRPLVTAGTLTATTTFEEAGSADVIIICVPTPLRKSKEPDISFAAPWPVAVHRDVVATPLGLSWQRPSRPGLFS